jgi:hypothetical protein
MSTQHEQKRLEMNYGKNFAGLITSGAFDVKPAQPPKFGRTATAAGRRWALASGVVTEGMFAEKLGRPLLAFMAMGSSLPQPDACSNPRAWRAQTANAYLEFVGRNERFAVPANALNSPLDARVNADTFAQWLGKTPTQLAEALQAGHVPGTVQFADGKHGWTVDAMVAHLLTATA